MKFVGELQPRSGCGGGEPLLLPRQCRAWDWMDKTHPERHFQKPKLWLACSLSYRANLILPAAAQTLSCLFFFKEKPP